MGIYNWGVTRESHEAGINFSPGVLEINNLNTKSPNRWPVWAGGSTPSTSITHKNINFSISQSSPFIYRYEYKRKNSKSRAYAAVSADTRLSRWSNLRGTSHAHTRRSGRATRLWYDEKYDW